MTLCLVQHSPSSQDRVGSISNQFHGYFTVGQDTNDAP